MSSTASVSASAATDGQPPWKKKQKEAKEQTSNPSLPNDLVVTCLARVSRLYYPNLSLVSKNFRSIIASPELYQTRTLLGLTENFLYVCLLFPHETNPRWFILKPNQTLTNHTTKKSKKKKKKKDSRSGNRLASITILNSPTVEWSGLIAVGSNLYAISKDIEEAPYSNIWFLDCRTHTWLEVPRMRLSDPDGEFERKMYLPGSSENPDSLNCVEVYNTKTQTWKPVPPETLRYEFGNIQGKIYIRLDEVFGVAFKPKDLKWELVGLDVDSDKCPVCMIKNITYFYNNEFLWKKFRTGGSVWRRVAGLEGLPFASYCTVRLADYGGKLVVF
ncbi:F-box-like domain superfamily [Arabidopsis suecica]|uniref:F-box-like domain superfamily n=1 Tax=Arabidopsis suecica TaxID=45249 RepID=A0A8T2BUE7_ARASU|nr:F-box-like domain superfamily [Arabidopsis suecica]